MKNLFVLVSFFIAAPFALVLTLTFALFLSYQSTPGGHGSSSLLTSRTNVAYAALPPAEESFVAEIGADDAKTESVRQFLARYNSPLEPYAEIIVQKALAYGIDQRLLPAIAMQESNLCKKVRADSAHNCWGFGIYGGKGRAFDSYEHAIEIVTKSLANKYKDNHGLVTPKEIEKMYNPNSTGSWASGVEQFMNEM